MRIKNWDIFGFIAGYHLLLLILLPAYIGVFTWQSAVYCFVGYAIAGFSITAGYHRLFSHQTYKANAFYEWVILISSSLAVQASALRWSHDHRIHHSHVDTDKDPYSIKKGFWYAHVWWLFDYQSQMDERLVSDLIKNPRVMFQDKYYGWLTLGVNLAAFGIGCIFLHPMEAFVGGVLLRIFAIQHCTWFINSLAHTYGSKTYAKELSAVDNALVALVTFGEGYHNFHHTIANDYRNGIRWYQFDPTKWLIWTSSKLGLTKDLRSVDKIMLLQRLVNKDKELFLDHIGRELTETAAELKKKVEDLSAAFEEKSAALSAKYRELKIATAEKKKLIEMEIRQLKLEIKALWKAWLHLSEFTTRHYAISH